MEKIGDRPLDPNKSFSEYPKWTEDTVNPEECTRNIETLIARYPRIFRVSFSPRLDQFPGSEESASRTVLIYRNYDSWIFVETENY